MLTFSALVAGSFAFGGRIANDIDPMALTAMRFVIAGLALAGLAAATGRLRRAHFRAPWRFAILGGLFSCYFVLMFEGLKTAHPVSVAAVFTLTPLIAAVTGFFIMRQVTTGRMAVALAIGAAGALWVIFRGDADRLLSFRVGKGELIYLVGCVCHAIYIPLVPRLNRGEPVLAFACGTMAAGAMILLVLGGTRLAATDFAALPPRVGATLLYLALFASVASISLLQFASLRLKAAKVMAYTYLTPIWVLIWEFVLAADLPPLALLPGVALAVTALVALLYEGRSSPAVSPSS